jgi:hypothetical protein
VINITKNDGIRILLDDNLHQKEQRYIVTFLGNILSQSIQRRLSQSTQWILEGS